MLASPLLERGCVRRRRELRELALQRAICMAGLPLSAAVGGGCRRLFVKLLAIDTPLGDVVRPVGVGSGPSDALPAPTPMWRGRATPSSFVAAALPSRGGAATARSTWNAHQPMSASPLLERGDVP